MIDIKNYYDFLSTVSPVIFSGLIAGLISGIVSYLKLRTDVKNELNKIKATFATDLYRQRISSYTKIFGILESITRAKPTSEKIKEIDKKIHVWKKDGGLLLLSEESWKAFYELEDAIIKRPGNGHAYTDKQIKNIKDARNKFREAIKMKDLGLYYSSEKDL